MLYGKQLGDAIRAALKDNDRTPADAARYFGVKPPSVSGWMSTGRISKENLVKLIQWLDKTPLSHWGAEGLLNQGQPVNIVGEKDHPGDAYIQIRESQVRFAAGNGRTAHFDELQDSVPATYRQEWFAKEGINPANARRFKVDGDSMEPFLHHGDTVLVNLAETSIINGKVYALRYGEELRIKRVYRKLDGGLILHSDNPDYLPRDEEIPPAVVEEHIAIIGRVRDKSGTGGL